MKDLTNIILNNKYQFEHKIGSGSYGIVYSARHLYTGKKYAIKIILKHQAPKGANGENGHGGNKRLLQQLERQLLYQGLANNGTLTTNLLSLDMIIKKGYNCKILREISLQLRVHKHPNILSIYKVYDIKEALFVVMDYLPEGDLFGTIVDHQRYAHDPTLIKNVFVQMVDAITYCHSKGVYHCDLKPENILVTDNGTRLILADFGLALREPYIESNVCCGSSYYMAPERIQNFCQGFDSKQSRTIHLERLLHPKSSQSGMRENVCFPTAAGDVWSLAIILINLISIRNPWLKASLNDTTFRAFVKDPAVLMKILPISRDIFSVLCRYLRLNPWERGNLFDFRRDVLTCPKLAESGPLSVPCSIPEDKFTACAVPVDHVAMSRVRSRENSGIESIEPEHNYIIGIPFACEPTPSNIATAAKAQGLYGPGNPGNGRECGSCVACGYGATAPEPYESIESLNQQSAVEQQLNNEDQRRNGQRALQMRHSRRNGVFRKIFRRRNGAQADGGVGFTNSQTGVGRPIDRQGFQGRNYPGNYEYAEVDSNGNCLGNPEQVLSFGSTQRQLPQNQPLPQIQPQFRQQVSYQHSTVRWPQASNSNDPTVQPFQPDAFLGQGDRNGGSPVNGANGSESGHLTSHTSVEGSTTDTMTGNASPQTSSASSVDASDPTEQVKPLVRRPEDFSRLAEDISMASIMSVRDSTTYMKL